MATIIGFAHAGVSDFDAKKDLPCLADNHGSDLSTEGVSEGFAFVLSNLESQETNWVDQFKTSRFFISKKS